MDTEKKKWERLARYFAKDCSEEEQRALESWLQQASDEEKAHYARARKLWENAGSSNDAYIPDIKLGWQQLQLKIGLREARKRPFPLVRLAAAVSLLALFTFLLADWFSKSEMIRITATSQVEEVLLADGSQVWLNKGAVLSWPEDYNINNRTVHLTGEAFFEVKKAEGKRFTILTKNTRTEVIGTSFNLRAIPDEPVKVQVATGKVAFSDLDRNDAVFLEPGQEAVYSPSRQLSIVSKPIADPNYRAWQNRELTFKNTSLLDLARTLELSFDVKILVPDHLKGCRFTTSFKMTELKDILEVLAMTGDLKITKTPEGYVFSGNACDN